MPDVRANLDEIERLRHALVDFAHRQAEALEVANDEIRSVWRDLEEARDHWRHEVEIRNAMFQECTRAAMRAQEEGGWVDCSPYRYALEEAEHRLERIINAQYQFEQAVEAYQAAHQRVASAIDTDVSRAVSYLGAILSGLEDYRAAQILTLPSTAPQWGAEEPPVSRQRPSPGPPRRVEFKEGNIGGGESARGSRDGRQQRSEENWRSIKTTWENTQGSWKGDNADRFEVQFWAQFERDIEDYLRALETLDEAINRARAEINE